LGKKVGQFGGEWLPGGVAVLLQEEPHLLVAVPVVEYPPFEVTAPHTVTDQKGLSSRVVAPQREQPSVWIGGPYRCEYGIELTRVSDADPPAGVDVLLQQAANRDVLVAHVVQSMEARQVLLRRPSLGNRDEREARLPPAVVIKGLLGTGERSTCVSEDVLDYSVADLHLVVAREEGWVVEVATLFREDAGVAHAHGVVLDVSPYRAVILIRGIPARGPNDFTEGVLSLAWECPEQGAKVRCSRGWGDDTHWAGHPAERKALQDAQ